MNAHCAQLFDGNRCRHHGGLPVSDAVCHHRCRGFRPSIPRAAPTPVSAEAAAARLATCRTCDQSGALTADGDGIHCLSGCATCGGARPAFVSLTVGMCQRGRWAAWGKCHL